MEQENKTYRVIVEVEVFVEAVDSVKATMTASRIVSEIIDDREFCDGNISVSYAREAEELPDTSKP